MAAPARAASRSARRRADAWTRPASTARGSTPSCCSARRRDGSGRGWRPSRRSECRPMPRGDSARWCGGGCGASRSPTSSAARDSADRARGRPAGAGPAAGDRAAGRAGARAGAAAGARRRHRLGRGRAGDRRRAARLRGDRDRHLGRRRWRSPAPTPSGSASRTGSSLSRRCCPRSGAGFDLLVANLPYVGEAEWAGLEPEVTEWEPREALLAGPDGLDAIRAPRSPALRQASRRRWRSRSGRDRLWRSASCSSMRASGGRDRAPTWPASRGSSGGDDGGPRSSR